MKYILFTGSSCKACPAMKRNLHAATIEYEELNVDVKENRMIAGLYQVKSLPTLVVVNDGNPQASFVGVRPVVELVQIKMRFA